MTGAEKDAMDAVKAAAQPNCGHDATTYTLGPGLWECHGCQIDRLETELASAERETKALRKVARAVKEYIAHSAEAWAADFELRDAKTEEQRAVAWKRATHADDEDRRLFQALRAAVASVEGEPGALRALADYDVARKERG